MLIWKTHACSRLQKILFICKSGLGRQRNHNKSQLPDMFVQHILNTQYNKIGLKCFLLPIIQAAVGVCVSALALFGDDIFPFVSVCCRFGQTHGAGGGTRGPWTGRGGGHAGGGQSRDGGEVRGVRLQCPAQRPHLPRQNHPRLQAQKVSTFESST